MRVLHIIIGLGMGGAERSLARLVAAHKADARYEHHVLTLTCQNDLRQDILDAGATVTSLGLTGAINLPAAFTRLLEQVRWNRPDVVHCWMYHSDLLGGIAARACGVKKVVWSVRNAHLEGRSRLKRALRRTCAVVSWIVPTRIVCVGEQVRRNHEAIGYASDRMLVIPNGYDMEQLCFDEAGRHRIRLQLGFAPDDIVVGSMGRFSPAKNHANLLRAASIAASSQPKLKFLLVGRNIAEKSEIARLVAEGGLAGRVHMPGQTTDVVAYLSAMDIFCLHSDTEGFPNVLAEAMATARPCVATDAGDSRIMLDGLAPVVPTGAPHALAEALIGLASTPPDERAAMGARLRDRLGERYSIASVIARYERLYDAL